MQNDTLLLAQETATDEGRQVIEVLLDWLEQEGDEFRFLSRHEDIAYCAQTLAQTAQALEIATNAIIQNSTWEIQS